jgi:hypothetical protein
MECQENYHLGCYSNLPHDFARVTISGAHTVTKSCVLHQPQTSEISKQPRMVKGELSRHESTLNKHHQRGIGPIGPSVN